MLLRSPPRRADEPVQLDAGWPAVAAWRQGRLGAAGEFVRARQPEALFVAWLLTGDAGHARDLTTAAFLRLLRSTNTLDPEIDPRLALLVSLGRCFIADDRAGHQGMPARHGVVESERERALVSLGRLDACQRLALVLGEVGGLDDVDARQALDDAGCDTSITSSSARHRFRQTNGLDDGQPVRGMLLDAGLDRPQDDLWGSIREPLIAINQARTRRTRRMTAGMAGVLLVALVAVVVLLKDDAAGDDTPVMVADIAATEDVLDLGQVVTVPLSPTPSPTLLPAGIVPDTLLVEIPHVTGSEIVGTSRAIYDESQKELRLLPDAPFRLDVSPTSTRISADGTQLVTLEGDWRDDTVRYTLSAIDTGTLQLQWQVELGAFERDPDSGISVRTALAVTSGQVYVALLDKNLTLYTFDRRDGTLRDSNAVDITPLKVDIYFRGNVFLFVPPDESRLILALEVWDQNTGNSVDGYLYSLDLQTLDVTGATVTSLMDGLRQGFSLWAAPMTPAGDALYDVRTPMEGGPPEVAFLDLESGEIDTLELPFKARHMDYAPQHITVRSNDGRRLYVLDRISAEVAVVDLAGRRVERFFPIDLGAFSSNFGMETDQLVFGWERRLSLDGERLYVVAGGIDQRDPPSNAGIWVIDMREWQVVDFWPVSGGIGTIFADLGEDAILVRTWEVGSSRQGYVYHLTRVGVENGSVRESRVEMPSAKAESNPTFISLPGLYRSQHGRAPVIDGVEPVDVEIESLSPRIEITLPPDVVSGVSTTFEVRLLHPETGAVLRSRTPGVRFDPDASVTIVLRSEGRPDQIIVPSIFAGGVYRAPVSVPAAGSWSIGVSITGPDGMTVRRRNAGAFEAAPSFLGTDDRFYRFRVSTEPAEPVAGEELGLRLDLVDVEAGSLMPESVEPAEQQPALEGEQLTGMPERIDVRLSGAGPDAGYRTALLYQASPGVYTGAVVLNDVGVWQADARFQPPGGRRIEFPVGVLEIVGTS